MPEANGSSQAGVEKAIRGPSVSLYRGAHRRRAVGFVQRGEGRAEARRCVETSSKTFQGVDLTAALKESFDYCDGAVNSLTDATAAQMIKMFGRDGEQARYAVLPECDPQQRDVRHQIVAYYRAKNIWCCLLTADRPGEALRRRSRSHWRLVRDTENSTGYGFLVCPADALLSARRHKFRIAAYAGDGKTGPTFSNSQCGSVLSGLLFINPAGELSKTSCVPVFDAAVPAGSHFF